MSVLSAAFERIKKQAYDRGRDDGVKEENERIMKNLRVMLTANMGLPFGDILADVVDRLGRK